MNSIGLYHECEVYIRISYYFVSFPFDFLLEYFVDIFLDFQDWVWICAAHPFCLILAVRGKFSNTKRGFIFSFFAFNKEQTNLLLRLSFENKTVRHVYATVETKVSLSSEATSAASLVLVTKVSLKILSLMLIRVVSTNVSRVPW